MALVGAAILLLPVLAIHKIAMQPRSLIGRSIVGERTMPDGSLLVLEQVTTESPHRFEYELRGTGSLAKWLHGQSANPNAKHEFSLSPSDGAMMLWLTRWDATARTPMDFDWWQSSVLVNENGEEIEDGNPQRHVWDGAASSTMGADRPWKPHAGTPPKVIIGMSELPMLRPSAAPRRLRVYDRGGAVVAEFDLPPAVSRPIPTWMPEPLPAVKSDDGVTVTFTGTSVKARPDPKIDGIELAHRRPHWSVVPEYSVAQNGHPAPDWKQESLRLSDALGNITLGYDCRLSVDEPAWKLQMTLARDNPASFLPQEQFTSEPLALPGADSSQPLNGKATVQGVELLLTAIGRGAVEYHETGPGSNATHYTDSHLLGNKTYNISQSTQSRSGGPTTSKVAISGDVVHLVFKLANLPLTHRDLIRVHDDQGRELPHRLDRMKGSHAAKYFVFVDPPADAQSVRLTVFIHTARTVELLIAPPKP